MHKLIIRDMREDDIPAILEIEQISFSTPWCKESFLHEIYKKYAFSKVAIFEENVIGYICANYLHHESHILNLAVHPDFRRRGVATILMNEAKKELKKKGWFFCILKSEFQILVHKNSMNFSVLRLKLSEKNTMTIQMRMHC